MIYSTVKFLLLGLKTKELLTIRRDIEKHLFERMRKKAISVDKKERG